jgi:hypothetical protein
MFKNGVLTIDYDTWKDGIASSPLVGCGDLRNADIFSQRGALLCGLKAAKESGPTIVALPRYMRHDEENDRVFIGDADGNLYIRSSGGGYSVTGFEDAGDCQGLEFWRGHVLYADTTQLLAYDPDIPNSYGDIEEFEEGQRGVFDLPHVAHVGQDDVICFTDGRYIASLQEVPGQVFDPGNTDTYTWNATALDLPEGYIATTLTEIGTYLLIGTRFGAATNRGNRAHAFPWDRVSPSFNIPLRTKGNGIWQAIEKENVVYTLVDRDGLKVYASNLTAIEMQREFKRLGFSYDLNPDAVEQVDDELLFGVGAADSSSHSLGIYSLRDGALQLRHTLSCGETDIEIGSVLNLGNGTILASWRNNNDGNCGVDAIGPHRCTGYATVVETPLFTVGTATEAQAFSQIDINLAKKLATGQGVRVKYREHLDDEWTTIGTFDHATFGAVSKMNAEAKVGDVSTIQLRIELTAASNSTDSPELLSVTLF